MKRVLITGMSGTGKSAVVRELNKRGFRAVDLDTPDWSEWVEATAGDQLTPAEGQDWVWREDSVRALLSEPGEGTLFVSGCAENMQRLYPLIELIILLSAPIAIIMERLQARTAGYGRTWEEREKIARLVSAVEPLLRAMADHEIDTNKTISDTVDDIVRLSGAANVPDLSS